MARGGARKGAGRKVSALTTRTRSIAERATAEGLTPLEYMLGILRDENADKTRRDDMAKAAAPYVHPKLANIDANVKANVDGTVTFTWLPPS